MNRPYQLALRASRRNEFRTTVSATDRHEPAKESATRFKPIKIITGALLLAVAGHLVAGNCEDDYCIDWYTISSGGEILADDGNSPPQWQLSGTIGQWEATEARELSGGDWRLTGGFWGMTLEELADFLFRDRFEPGQ